MWLFSHHFHTHEGLFLKITVHFVLDITDLATSLKIYMLTLPSTYFKSCLESHEDPYIHVLQTNSFTERIYNVVKKLLKELFNENPSKNNGSILLHFAAIVGHFKI